MEKQSPIENAWMRDDFELSIFFHFGYESFKRINNGQVFEYSKLLLHPEWLILRSTKYSTRLLSTGPTRSEIYTRQKAACEEVRRDGNNEKHRFCFVPRVVHAHESLVKQRSLINLDQFQSNASWCFSRVISVKYLLQWMRMEILPVSIDVHIVVHNVWISFNVCCCFAGRLHTNTTKKYSIQMPFLPIHFTFGWSSVVGAGIQWCKTFVSP